MFKLNPLFCSCAHPQGGGFNPLKKGVGGKEQKKDVHRAKKFNLGAICANVRITRIFSVPIFKALCSHIVCHFSIFYGNILFSV